jgi:hypothetical protein
LVVDENMWQGVGRENSFVNNQAPELPGLLEQISKKRKGLLREEIARG